MRTYLAQAGLAALCALALTGCIDSSGPILASSQDVFGAKLKLQFYSLREGRAREPAQAEFTWNGSLYARSSGALREVSAFSVHPFEAGDYIIQSSPVRHPQLAEYSLMRKLAEGVYQVLPIDEADADEATRAADCKHPQGTACRIETREQLFAFARATAAKRKTDGGLAILLSDGK